MINSFCTNLSKNRVAMYSNILQIQNDKEKFSYAYLALQDITSSFYPLFQLTEITLRNRLNKSLQAEYKKNYWYEDLHLTNITRNHFVTARSKAESKSIDHFICEVPFGAWVNLLDPKSRGAYSDQDLLKKTFIERDQIEKIEKFWMSNIDVIFLGRNGTKPNTIYDFFQDVNKYRNRFSHYEAIWKPKRFEKNKPFSFENACDVLIKKFERTFSALTFCCPDTAQHLKKHIEQKFLEKISSYKEGLGK